MSSVITECGTSSGALGGQTSFLGQARLAGGAAVQAGKSGGLGGLLDFSGNAVALGTSSIYAEGGTSALAGAEGVASLRGDARFFGAAYLGAGGVSGARGGRIVFFDRGRRQHELSGPLARWPGGDRECRLGWRCPSLLR